MTYKEIIKHIENDGWYLDRQKGSHRQYKHLVKKGLVTIAHHGLTEKIAPKMMKSILKQAQINEEEIL
jgi:predicted RNA binding protein YcfA (HicA-like mRNA interferase family)